MIKKLCRILATVFMVVMISSCASTAINEDTALLTKHENSMFWEINGLDKNSNPSTVYVLGTIHVGDDRLYPLPDEILNAFDSSDRVVSELSLADWNNMVPEMLYREYESALKEAARVVETGKTLDKYLTEEEKNFIINAIGEENFAALINFEPWVLFGTISSLPTVGLSLVPEKGIDTYIIQKSIEKGIDVEGLDTLDTQFDLLTFGDWDTQLLMLKDLIKEYIEEPEASNEELIALYEAYLTADEEVFNEMFEETEDEEIDTVYSEDYYDAMFLDRNRAWADKFADYLNEGGKTFIFAGSGHFVGEDSVFNIMKANNTLR